MFKQAVYVLNLQSNKKYVGSTSDLDERLRQHSSSDYSSAWVQKFPMENVLAIYPCPNDDSLRLLEEEVTYDMMKKFGVDNVRGAAFVKPEMESDEREAICKLLLHRDDKCIKCGAEGHYVNNCPNNQKSVSGFWGWVKEGLEVAKEMNQCSKNTPTNQICYRCGRAGHWATSCYAKSHVSGRQLQSR